MAAEIRDLASALPDLAMAEIVRRLPCRTDRGNMAAVCRAWRAKSQIPDRPPPLPWLLIPTADSTRVHCFLSDYHHHCFKGPPHGARYFGSHDGAWLFVAYDQTGSNVLLNLRDLDAGTRFLPNQVDGNRGVVDGVVILAATLSAPPDDPDCIGAFIFTTRGSDIPYLRRFALWRMGSLMARDVFPEPEPGWPAAAHLEVEDVAFHGAAFHFLTRGEHIFFCQQAPLDEDEHVPSVGQLKLIPFRGGHNYGGLLVLARYLVYSGVELLMVVRLANPQLRTSSFRVFRMIPAAQLNQADGDEDDVEEGGQDVEEDDEGEEVGDQDAEEDQELEDQGVEEDNLVEQADGHPWSWGELDTLDGRLLFVGRGCSRSYNVAQYPDLKAGIYFFDDKSFYDAQMMVGDVNERQYPCDDNGKWSEGPPPNVERFIPDEVPSRQSSPAWLMPPRVPPQLPADVIAKIICHLKCDTELIRALRALHLHLQVRPIQPQLPWIVRFLPDGPSICCLTCTDGASNGFQFHPAGAPVDVHGPQCFGSCDGRWLFLSREMKNDNIMVNVITGELHVLPGNISFQQGGSYGHSMLAATMYGSPRDTCILAAIVRYKHPTIKPMMKPFFGREGDGHRTQIAVWSLSNDDVAFDPLSGLTAPVYANADDILFRNGTLHCITQGDHIFVWTPTFLPNGQVLVDDIDSWQHFFVEYTLDGEQVLPEEKFVCSRYLVESRGDLLVVIRYRSPVDQMRTENFRLFRLEVPKLDISQHGPPSCFGTEQTSLDGRMLFVGRACSRSYETTDYPGFTEGIYFSDDRSFDDEDQRQYPGSDIGKWTKGPPPTVKFFFPEEGSSNHSSPAWILP